MATKLLKITDALTTNEGVLINIVVRMNGCKSRHRFIDVDDDDKHKTELRIDFGFHKSELDYDSTNPELTNVFLNGAEIGKSCSTIVEDSAILDASVTDMHAVIKAFLESKGLTVENITI